LTALVNKLLKYDLDFKIILAAVLYYLAARLGYFLAFEETTALPSWPPSGIAFALVIILGRSSWPGITIGALIANVMAYWNSQVLDQNTIITISGIIALGQTVETLAGNFLVKSWIRDKYPFRSAKDTFRFFFVSLFMCLIGASIGTMSLFLNGVVTMDALLSTGFTWWVGHVVGILLFTPFILAVAQKRKFNFHPRKVMEGGIFVLFMIGVYLVLQMAYFNSTFSNAIPYLLIPLLLWLAFRFNLLAAITGALASSLIALYFTANNIGPFIQTNVSDSMLLLQIFIGVISISTIVVSATVAERTEAQSELKLFNSNLEEMVQERTKALNNEINTRREAENSLVQTNTELSKRNTELDNFVYSVSHDLRAPIASILGLINLANKDKDTAMRDLYLDKIHSSAVQQDNFIKEILDQSRNSRLEVKKEEIQFDPLINETFDQLKFATATGIAVEKLIHVKQDSIFFSDRWRLKVILNNIISNSIRYRNGRDPIIKINVEVEAGKAVIEIEDNGRGIAKKHLQNVYKMFYRATDYGAGSGLGLYIVKETVDKLLGSINIESEEGQGTKVRIEVPGLQ
jgi:signal transduction histidine kinase